MPTDALQSRQRRNADSSTVPPAGPAKDGKSSKYRNPWLGLGNLLTDRQTPDPYKRLERIRRLPPSERGHRREHFQQDG